MSGAMRAVLSRRVADQRNGRGDGYGDHGEQRLELV
jgi:hypothetical protein